MPISTKNKLIVDADKWFGRYLRCPSPAMIAKRLKSRPKNVVELSLLLGLLGFWLCTLRKKDKHGGMFSTASFKDFLSRESPETSRLPACYAGRIHEHLRTLVKAGYVEAYEDDSWGFKGYGKKARLIIIPMDLFQVEISLHAGMAYGAVWSYMRNLQHWAGTGKLIEWVKELMALKSDRRAGELVQNLVQVGLICDGQHGFGKPTYTIENWGRFLAQNGITASVVKKKLPAAALVSDPVASDDQANNVLAVVDYMFENPGCSTDEIKAKIPEILGSESGQKVRTRLTNIIERCDQRLQRRCKHSLQDTVRTLFDGICTAFSEVWSHDLWACVNENDADGVADWIQHRIEKRFSDLASLCEKSFADKRKLDEAEEERLRRKEAARIAKRHATYCNRSGAKKLSGMFNLQGYYDDWVKALPIELDSELILQRQKARDLIAQMSDELRYTEGESRLRVRKVYDDGIEQAKRKGQILEALAEELVKDTAESVQVATQEYERLCNDA